LKKRNRNARTERDGVLAVETACNELELIWRDILQEDVGVDGTIEIALGDFPSGKIVAAQVKSGLSYIRSETDENFRFYPSKDDLEYWSKLSIPLFLLVHHPTDKQVFWVDVSKSIQESPDKLADKAYILFDKSQKLNASFQDYLSGRFDLIVYDDERLATVDAELAEIKLDLGTPQTPTVITARDIFICGLWGLCSKVIFHSSVLTSEVRRIVQERNDDFLIRYTFERSTLYPFITQYINALCRHNLALIDVNDVNETLYNKFEVPTFISPLSTNGRAFVNYLRENVTERARDNQLMTLSSLPLEQIEVYSSFDDADGDPNFGPWTAVLAINFNPHLDYYEVQHWRRNGSEGPGRLVASQSMFFFELTEYIERVLGDVEKDNILLRHLDLPLTPLICWLEDWYGLDQHIQLPKVPDKTNAEKLGLHDEITATFSGAGVMSITEPPLPRLPIRRLANGEVMALPE
jgi:hypothetical protein